MYLLAAIARAINFIHIPWAIILLPEIFCALFLIVIFTVNVIDMIKERKSQKK